MSDVQNHQQWLTVTAAQVATRTERPEVSFLTDWVLKDERFSTWSGSSKNQQHHYGDSGLITHTVEVVKTCLEVRKLYPNYDIDEAELFLAALFHDTGKMFDYVKINNVWQGSEHKRKIHHISRSAILWTKAISEIKPSDEFVEKYEDRVLHAILAHHGLRAWGSPVMPESRVAWLLHLCDGISARLHDADTWDFTK